MSSVIEGPAMSSVASEHESGAQLFLPRECWFSAEAIALLEAACDDPAVGPRKVLSCLLHDGLGCPLSLVGRITGQTKNVVKTQVITGRRHMRRLTEAAETGR